MSRTDDIKNLFNKFGASSDNYQEIDFNYEQIEGAEAPPLKTAPVTPIAAALPAQPEPLTNVPAITAVTPVVVSAPEAVSPPVDPAPVAESLPAVQLPGRKAPLLRDLLQELNRARQNNDVAIVPVRRDRTEATVIAVISAKGGVGKSLLAASLAKTLQPSTGRVLAVDLDPQNALAFHLGIDPSAAGLSQASAEESGWADVCLTGDANSLCLGYGPTDDEARSRLEQKMQADPGYVASHLANLNLTPHDVVIVDTPVGNTPYLAQLLKTVDLIVVVTTADSTSFLALDAVNTWLQPTLQRAGLPLCRYVVNQVDSSRQLSLDILELLRRRLGNDLIAIVHSDPVFSEALAYGHDPLEQSPEAIGCRDIQSLSDAVQHLLLTKYFCERIGS